MQWCIRAEAERDRSAAHTGDLPEWVYLDWPGVAVHSPLHSCKIVAPLDLGVKGLHACMHFSPDEWSTGPPPLVKRAEYRSGYAFSKATHRSRKWSLSLLISIFKSWSTFSALDEQFWSSSNRSSWLKVPDTSSNSISRSASVMDSNKFWWHWSNNSLCFGSMAVCCSSVANRL